MDKFVLTLVIIGAVNWGCIGLFGLDIVGALFGGQGAMISRIIYAVIGLAGSFPSPVKLALHPRAAAIGIKKRRVEPLSPQWRTASGLGLPIPVMVRVSAPRTHEAPSASMQ